VRINWEKWESSEISEKQVSKVRNKWELSENQVRIKWEKWESTEKSEDQVRKVRIEWAKWETSEN